MKGDIADADINQLAGKALSRARELLGRPRVPMSQPMFMSLIKKELGFAEGDHPFSQSAFSDWEGGKSTVPAAIVIAAARVVTKRLEPTLVEELVEDRETVKARLRDVVDALLRERSPRPGSEPEPAVQPPRPAGRRSRGPRK